MTTMTTEQDVNKATAALKGMLGLGTTPTAVSGSFSVEDPAAASPVAITPNNNIKKKRNNNSNNNRKKKENEIVKTEEKTISPKDNNRHNVPSNKKKKNTKKPVIKEPETTYALSAFQSSPDASKLPIPAFASPVSEKKTLSPGELAPFELLSNITAEHNVDIYESKADVGKRSTNEEEKVVAVKEKEPDAESRNDAPVSTTGVNLAVLAAKPPTTDQTSSSSVPPPMIMNNVPQHPMQLPQHLPHFGSPPPNAHMSPYMHHQIPNYTSPIPPQYQLQHMHHHPYTPPPPPGYILINVQVPPNLNPARQMIVTAPSGFPVQVIVPEGIPAGAWMPVHVPGNPPHMVPHPMMQQHPPPPSPAMFERIDDNNQYSPPRLG